jgi:hypothetical protein
MAREMAQKAFEEKLREIKMSKYEGNVYEDYLGPIRPQVKPSISFDQLPLPCSMPWSNFQMIR